MIINEKTEIVGNKVVMVPYDEHLVPRYHLWMQCDELLKATASERLTLKEEFEMQKSWRQDEDKLTFIVLDHSKISESGHEASMIGDANLFMIEPKTAEVMIMIAEKSYRRQGFGSEALLLILRYGMETLDIEKFIAKISSDNIPSIALFMKIGFQVESESNVFQEITLTQLVSTVWRKWLLTTAPCRYIENS